MNWVQWSPGVRILYLRQSAKLTLNTIVDPETEEEKPLAPGDTGNALILPIYSPDGKRLAYSRDDQGKVGLWMVFPADNSTKLLTDAALNPFGWSPDGNWIYATDSSKPDKTSIVLVPSGGGNPKTIFTSNSMRRFFGWSPDGNWIYGVNSSAPGTTNFLSVPTGGGDPKILLTVPGAAPFQVSPDGRRFIWRVSESKSDVWLVENFDPANRK